VSSTNCIASIPLGQPDGTPNPRPGEQQATSGPALYQADPEPRRIGYQFVAMPPIAFELCGQGKLPWSALGVLASLVRFQDRVPGSCWTTIGELAKIMTAANGHSLETNERTARRLLSQIFGVGLVGRRVVPVPDPQEPANRTGYRYDFLWASDSMSPRILGEERPATGGEDTSVPQRLGDNRVRNGGQPCPKARTKMSPNIDRIKLDRSKSSSEFACETREATRTKTDDDEISRTEEKGAPRPEDVVHIPTQGPIPDPVHQEPTSERERLALPAAKGPAAVDELPAAPVARSGVPESGPDPRTPVQNDTLVPPANALPGDRSPEANFPEIIKAIRALHGDDLANEVERCLKGQVLDACQGKWDVLVPAVRTLLSCTYEKAFPYLMKIVAQYAATEAPYEFSDAGWAAKVKADAEKAAKAALLPSQKNPSAYANDKLKKQRDEAELPNGNALPPFAWKMGTWFNLAKADQDEWRSLSIPERLAIVARDRALSPPESWMKLQKGSDSVKKRGDWRKLPVAEREAIIAKDPAPCEQCARSRELLASPTESRGRRIWGAEHLVCCSKATLDPSEREELNQNLSGAYREAETRVAVEAEKAQEAELAIAV
jgi:hypothetical protein